MPFLHRALWLDRTISLNAAFTLPCCHILLISIVHDWGGIKVSKNGFPLRGRYKPIPATRGWHAESGGAGGRCSWRSGINDFFSLLIVALLAAIVEQVVYRERLAYALESKGFEILAQVGG